MSTPKRKPVAPRSPPPKRRAQPRAPKHRDPSPSPDALGSSSVEGDESQDPAKVRGRERFIAEKLAYTDEEALHMLLAPSPAESSLLAKIPPTQVLSPEQELVMSQGWTPLEYLAHTYRNPFVPQQHRIAAARACLDYVHKRQPAPVALGNDPANPLTNPDAPHGAVRLDPSKLSDKELDTLLGILTAAQQRGDNNGS